MMLRINLLPEESRRGQSAVEQFHRAPIMLVIIGVLIAIAVAVVAPIPFRQQRLVKLTARLQELETKKRQVEQLERMVQQLRAEEATLRDVKERRALVSRFLNTLSDAAPDGVWFTDLSFDVERGLVIQGSAVSQSDPGMASVTRFVQELKASPAFSSVVKSIQIESIKRTMEKEIEIVQFTVACTFTDKDKKTP